MGVKVPSLTSQLFLTDVQSVIGYTLNRYATTPKDTVPILPDLIISLPWRIATLGSDPDNLAAKIQSDLQNTFNRIFEGDRSITVSCTHTPAPGDHYNIALSVMYTLLSGEVEQTGTTLKLNKETGLLDIPENQIEWLSRAL